MRALLSSFIRSYAVRLGTVHALLFVAGAIGIACSSTTDGASGKSTPEVRGASEIGKKCEAACGSGDSRKCALPSPDCASDMCIVDPGQPVDHLAYCTTDCTSAACPSGYHCEDIKGFETASRACVADPMNCGDQIVQLGEVCDGDSDQGTCSDDCTKLSAVCGDGVVQAGEVCEGDTKDGYCVDCTKIAVPHLKASRVTIGAKGSPNGTDLDLESTASFDSDLPKAGDADGCGETKILEATSELTRLSWTVCDETAKLTWRFAIPRAPDSGYDVVDRPPPSLKATATLVDRASGKSIEFDGEGSPSIHTWAALSGQPAHELRGQFMWHYGDPTSWYWAQLTFDFVLTLPVLP